MEQSAEDAKKRCVNCVVCGNSASSYDLFRKSRVSNRGPDCSDSVTEMFPAVSGFCSGWSFYLRGFVLHHRGPDVTSQPRRVTSQSAGVTSRQTGGWLLWNGEIFDGVEISDGENDTAWLCDKLSRLSGDDEDQILNLLSRVRGPWALVYLDHQKRLWFGRDILGRRSLLWNLPATDAADSENQVSDLILTSTAIDVTALTSPSTIFSEIPTDGLYRFDIKTGSLTLYPWTKTPSGDGLRTNYLSTFPMEISDLKMRTESCIENDMNMQVESDHMDNCTDTGANNSVDQRSTSNNDLKLDDIFQNVSGDQKRIRDEFERILSDAVRRRVEMQSSLCGQCIRLRLKGGEKSEEENALKREEGKLAGHCRHARVAVLFSGGIDSMMIAALTHRHVAPDEPIDLLNVAFKQKPKRQQIAKRNRKKKGDVASGGDGDPASENEVMMSKGDALASHGVGAVTSESDVMTTQEAYLVPDRVTGLAAWRELTSLYPTRRWKFFNINVTAEELREARESSIRHLVSPLQTVLDDSIGCAVWFAARGRGLVHRDEDCASFIEENSTARVLLLGMGADEQLGGYSRHRNAYSCGGLPSLVAELRRDVDRLSERNLGRDDRVVSDHGKEARFPFLDESVVSFLNGLAVEAKMDLSLPRGYGEKFLLRHLAAKLGLKSCRALPKRAIQFGSRIAKLEDGKEKASDVCARLDNVKIS